MVKIEREKKIEILTENFEKIEAELEVNLKNSIGEENDKKKLQDDDKESEFDNQMSEANNKDKEESEANNKKNNLQENDEISFESPKIFCLQESFNYLFPEVQSPKKIETFHIGAKNFNRMMIKACYNEFLETNQKNKILQIEKKNIETINNYDNKKDKNNLIMDNDIHLSEKIENIFPPDGRMMDLALLFETYKISLLGLSKFFYFYKIFYFCNFIANFIIIINYI